MPAKRHKPEELITSGDKSISWFHGGKSVADAVRAIGVTKVTYVRRRQQFGGLKSGQVKRMKDLEAKNDRLRRAAPISRWI